MQAKDNFKKGISDKESSYLSKTVKTGLVTCLALTLIASQQGGKALAQSYNEDVQPPKETASYKKSDVSNTIESLRALYAVGNLAENYDIGPAGHGSHVSHSSHESHTSHSSHASSSHSSHASSPVGTTAIPSQSPTTNITAPPTTVSSPIPTSSAPPQPTTTLAPQIPTTTTLIPPPVNDSGGLSCASASQSDKNTTKLGVIGDFGLLGIFTAILGLFGSIRRHRKK